MIVYLDPSALVKRYVTETGSAEVDGLIAQADAVGTAVISRAEVAAALAKAARMGALPRDEAQAGALAWDHGLRGYDAVHLAVARFWQSSLGEPVVLAAFDRQLWQAGAALGLGAWPEDLGPFLRRA